MNRRFALGLVGCLGALSAACGSGSAGPAGPAGPQGPAGTGSGGTGTASVSGVEPSTAYLARTAHVTVSGYGTAWTDKTTIDFGMGITVSNVHAASPTALVADIAIDKAAAMGPRDVVVNDTPANETYKQAFTVSAPAALTLQGSLAQGSIAIANIQLQDQSTPFDTTSQSDPFGDVTYTNLAVTTPAGVTAQIESATTTSIQVLLTVDVDATAAAADFDLLSGPAADPTDADFPVPGGLTVTAQKATALTATPAMGNINAAYGSVLYSYTPGAALSIVDISASSNVTNASPGFVLLPSTGHFSDSLGFFQPTTSAAATTTVLPTGTTPYYIIYWDNSGTTGAYTVGATATAPASTLATTATDDTQAGALVATALPFVLTGGTLTTASSIDWVQITTGSGDAGKVIHVQTTGDPLTDVAVNILDSDGATSIGGDDEGAPIDTTSSPIAASTTYYVTFAAGTLDFDPADGSYDAIIRIE
jgi:hypothetical protein